MFNHKTKKLEVAMKKITVLSTLIGVLFCLNSVAQIETIITHTGLPGDSLGWSVAIDEGELIIGSPGRQGGVFPIQTWSTGVAYIYDYNEATGQWDYVHNEAVNLLGAKVGASVSISGLLALAGAPGCHSGSAYNLGVGLMMANKDPWEKVQTLHVEFLNPVARFGQAVDVVSHDIALLPPAAVVGAPGEEAFYVFVSSDYFGYSWQDAERFAPDPNTDADVGASVAIGRNEGWVLVGGPLDDQNGVNSGCVYFHNYFGIQPPEKVVPSDGTANEYFGTAVDIDTSLAIIGAPGDVVNGFSSGSVYVYERNGYVWTFSQKLTPDDPSNLQFFGASLSLSVSQYGKFALIGAPGDPDNAEGHAYLFEQVSGDWIQVAKISASDGVPGDYFAISVGLSECGAIIGAPKAYVQGSGNAGKVYVYEGLNRGLLTVNAQSLSFGNVAIGSSETSSITLTNMSLDTLYVDTIRIVGANQQLFNTNTTPILLLSGESHSLDVTYQPTSLGYHSANLLFKNRFGVLKTIPLSGTGSEILVAVPAAVDFGEVRTGYSHLDTLTLENTGNISLTVDSIVTSGDDLNIQFTLPVTPFNLSGGESEQIPLSFQPPLPGLYEAEMAVYSATGNVFVLVSGEGILAGQISIALDTLDFGTTSPTLSVMDTVAVGNVGSYSIVIDNVYMSGPDPENFNVLTGMLPITLPPGSYLPFQAYFNPQDTTEFHATFHVESNGGTDQIVLKGKGTNAGFLQFAPNMFDYGEVIAGHTATQELLIGNFGINDLHVTSITISGNDPNNFTIDDTPFTLAPTYIERLDVGFQPTTADEFTAFLNIDTDGGDATILLSGSGFTVLPSGETKVVADSVYMGHASVKGGHGLASHAQFYRADGSAWIEKEHFSNFAWIGNGSDVATDGLYAFIGSPYDTIDDIMESGSVQIYKQSGGSWEYMDEYVPDNIAMFDHFGHSVDFDGTHLIAGCPYNDEFGPDKGMAYVARFNNWGFSPAYKLYPRDAQEQPLFGLYTAISGDFAAVGRPEDGTNGFFSGAVYVFQKTGSGWNQSQKLFASDAADFNRFGESLAMDGEHLIIGSPGSNNAYIFHYDGNEWLEQAILSPVHASEEFGYAVSISGEYALIGTPYADFSWDYVDAGAAWLFEKQGNNWTERRMIRPKDARQEHFFGSAVDIDDGFLSMMIGTMNGEIYFYGDSAFLGINDAARNKLDFILEQNTPNPFSLSTTIRFHLPGTSYVTLEIYNAFGRRLEVLESNNLKAGKHEYTWNARNAENGLYFYKIRAGNSIAMKKMVRVR